MKPVMEKLQNSVQDAPGQQIWTESSGIESETVRARTDPEPLASF